MRRIFTKAGFENSIASIVFALTVVLCVSLAYADMSDRATLGGANATQVYDWRVDSSGDLIPGSNSTNTIGDATHVVSAVYADDFVMTSGEERSIEFTVGDFIINDGTSVAPITTTTSPGLEVDNKATSLVWADGEVTPAQVTFKVPSDYKSGGAFRVFCDESLSTTPNQVDFNVYVNKDGTVFDTAATDQTPVALAGTAGTPDLVTLSVATDFSAIAAGDVVTFNVWRDDTADGTGDLELYYAEFYYQSER